jgi:SAM-dependent methyltransferase
VCERCGALERQRALVRACPGSVAAAAGTRCLEIGPMSPMVFGGFLRERGWAYTSVDKWRTGNPNDPRAVGFIDDEMDVADLAGFANASFDLVIAQHVIEEVPAYLDALAAIERVLAPGGTALLEIPYDRTRPTSEAHAPNRFGNVWAFGRSLIDDLNRIFGSVETVALIEGDYKGELMVCSPGLRAT